MSNFPEGQSVKDVERDEILKLFRNIFKPELMPNEESSDRYNILSRVINCVIHQVKYDLFVRQISDKMEKEKLDTPDWLEQEEMARLRALHTGSTLRLEEIFCENIHLREEYERIRIRLTIILKRSYGVSFIPALQRYVTEFKAQIEKEDSEPLSFDEWESAQGSE